MREIKFRAWKPDGRKKNRGEMFGHFDLMDDYGNFDVESRDDHFVMQFTGLTDKSGVEIYEGDILERRSKYQDDVYERYECVWQYAGWYLRHHCKTYFTSEDPSWGQLEVIGNIHQNPDLLNPA